MKVKAIIIDDEKNAIEVLKYQIEKYCPNIQLVAIACGGKEGIAAIKEFNPELVFLDVEMPSINGFDVLEETAPYNYKVIFTTAYDKFAIKAFKYSAVGYLLKPIDIEELISTVSKVLEEGFYNLDNKVSQLLHHLDRSKQEKSIFALPSKHGFDMVEVESIIRCESDNNYTIVHLSDGRKSVLSKTLKEVEENIDNKTFFRIHASHLVNIKYIDKIFKTDGGYITMKDGYTINISRSKRDDFFEFIKKI
jgi:two-component system LytT family response regulator